MLVRKDLIVFFILIFYNHIYSQPITKDGLNIIRVPRQVDYETCCPCPDSANRNKDDGYPASMSSMVTQYRDRFPIKESIGTAPGSRNLDNCSYQSRSADSDGSSSILFPTSVRDNGYSARSSKQKEEQKNLLEPEVGLASSVLQTIREATEVEYQDALAREAAKTRDYDDVIANESAPNIVTIILPSHNRDNNDGVLSEDTHIHESSCIHPVGSPFSKIRRLKPISNNLLEKLSRVSNVKPNGLLNKNLLDVDNVIQASNVKESNLQKSDPGLKLKMKPELVENGEQNSCLIDSKINSKADQLASLAEQMNRNNAEKSVNLIDSLQILHSSLKPTTLPKTDLFKVKSLLKLRDTEFLSPNKKLDIPLLKLPSIFHRRLELPDVSDSLYNSSNLKNNKMWSSTRNCNNTLEENEPAMKTNILEELPNSSFNKMKEKNNKFKNSHQIPNVNIVPTEKDTKDLISSPTENIAIVNLNTNDEKRSLSVPDDVLKENEDVCTNVDQTFEEIENISNELNQNSSDLISDGTEEDRNILVTNNEDNSDHPSDTENEANDELSDNNCFEFTHDDREKTRSSTKVFDNNDNLDAETKSLITDDPFNSGNDKKSTSLDSDDLTGVSTFVNHNISFPLSQTLTSIKENIEKKIQEFRKAPTRKADKAVSDNNKQDELKSVIQETDDTYCQNAAMLPELELSKQNNLLEDGKKILDNISMEDLQKMSDSLLKMNELKDKLINFVNTKTYPTGNTNLKSDDSTETNSKELLNSRLPSSKMKKLPNLVLEKTDKAFIENKKSDNQYIRAQTDSDQTENDCFIEASPLRNTDKENNQPSHLSKGADPDEMTAEASDPIINAINREPLNLLSKLKSPLLQDIIVQPSSLIHDDWNSLSGGSGLDLSRLLNIPTLDEIKERIANLFGTNERDSEREGIDCESNSPIMSSEPSEPIFQSKSLLKPLEDIDIDIFQMKPLQIGESNLLPELPRINLKSYKAKLPIPKNLQITPMKLESTLGNNGGLLGAIFRIGPESNSKNILNSPLGKSSAIDDVTSQLKDKVESFLSSPLDTLQDFRQSSNIKTFPEDLRTETLNIIKGIQDNIGNPLKIAQNSDSLTGLVNQHDVFLEKLADATDDLNDKLKGLHYDLNDRILSLHENILDKTKLTLVNKPLFDNRKVKGSVINPLQRTTLSKTYLEHFAKEKGRKNNNLLKQHNRSEFEKVPQLRSSTINKNDKTKLKSYKMLSSASVPVPKSVAIPYLKQTGKESPLFDLARNPNVMAQSMIREGTENQPVISVPSKFKSSNNGQNANKPTNSLKDAKFTVTIASTTSSPLSALKSRKVINPVIKTKKNNVLRKPEFILGKSQTKDKHDNKSVPLMKIVTPELSYPRKVDEMENKDTKSKNDVKKPKGITTRKPIREWLEQRHASKTLPSNISDKKGAIAETPLDVLKSERINRPPKKEGNSWPEITDKSFLSKVRDAVKARAPSLDLVKTIEDNKNSEIISDTVRAASETTDVDVVSETLKENVSYKCRMVCNKET